MHQHLAVVRLLDEVVQHFFRDLEISDDPVFHRLDGYDVSGRAAQHLFGFFANGLNFTGQFIDGHDGGLVDYNAFAFGIDQRVGGPQIDGKIAGEHAEQRAKIVDFRILRVKSVR